MAVRRDRVTYKPDHKGIAKLALDAPMSKAMVNVAMEGMRYAISLAADDVKTGEYIRSFRVAPTIVPNMGWGKEPRAGATLANTSDHAAAVEWTDDQHVLGRTVEHLDDSPISRARRAAAVARKPSSRRGRKASGA